MTMKQRKMKQNYWLRLKRSTSGRLSWEAPDWQGWHSPWWVLQSGQVGLNLWILPAIRALPPPSPLPFYSLLGLFPFLCATLLAYLKSCQPIIYKVLQEWFEMKIQLEKVTNFHPLEKFIIFYCLTYKKISLIYKLFFTSNYLFVWKCFFNIKSEFLTFTPNLKDTLN